MSKRDFCRILDFSTDEILEVLELARELKKEVPSKAFTPRLKDKVLAMLFEKPSLRTRCTFEIAMLQMGGTAIYLGPGEVGIGKRESVYDIAKNLERWFDMVMIRTFAQKNVDELARHCSLPVINALSDLSHPCQVMADFLTVLEKRGSFKGFTLAYLGDGNNVCHSLISMTARLGTELRIASPKEYAPRAEWLGEVLAETKRTGAKIVVTENPAEAVKDADAIYTDVWASMGRESEAEARKKVFQPYQLNAALARGARPDAWIMHDLPAHRGEEITDEMIDSPRSIVFDQAENRLHAQKAIMVFLDERRG
jgi:ornithine carbamoyltransferase